MPKTHLQYNAACSHLQVAWHFSSIQDERTILMSKTILCVAAHLGTHGSQTVQKCVKKHDFGMRITWSGGPKLHTKVEGIQHIYF